MPLNPTLTLTVPSVVAGSGTSATSTLFGPWYTAAFMVVFYVTGRTAGKSCNGCALAHMTQTIDASPAKLSPQERVDAWLADFEAALAARDINRVVGKFA